ncbi:MAG: tRNA(adenine34) deaminase [Clostridia bacterium]|jgi:tRNA(adenine34) deaminase|nr:CMP/dCMP deaminase, zinc-binding [Clostridiales bacterium]MDK2985779.1 tRNA(adenine34) deaminase [Clostridia bacterium]
MKAALEEARKAYKLGEVPIGAVLVKDREIIVRDHNLRERAKDPLGHAEIRVIATAAKKLNNWRLDNTTLYVTLEPCPMCAGAIINSRISRVVFGALDPKAGAAGTVVNVLENSQFNHRVEVISGIMEDECKEIIQHFFKNLR